MAPIPADHLDGGKSSARLIGLLVRSSGDKKAHFTGSLGYEETTRAVIRQANRVENGLVA